MKSETQVILGQAVGSRTDYFRARRAGRGKSIGRGERAEIWQLAERFTRRLDRLGRQTWDQAAERAARLEMGREQRIRSIARQGEDAGGLDNIHLQDTSGGRLRHRYRHIVVDEAQDLRPAHWKMLRAMAPRTSDDLFLVGDTHQRIYKNQVTLGSLGVNIRGRSAKLTLSYRTHGRSCARRSESWARRRTTISTAARRPSPDFGPYSAAASRPGTPSRTGRPSGRVWPL
ncbi:UvrD-helicase domain-containing protein [Actinomadura keratinilytica]